VGWWGAAVRIIGIPIFIPVLVTTPLLPALSRCVDDRAVFRRTLQRSLVLMLGLTVPACALIIALAPVIPGLLGWQAGFDNAARLIMVLGPQVPLVATGMVLGTSVVALGDERRWLGINALTTVLSGGVMLLAIPTFDAWLQNGAIGAALSRVVCEILMIAGAAILMPRGMIDRATLWTVARIVVASAALAMVVALVRSSSLVLAVAAGGLTFVAVAVALGLTRSNDIQTLWIELGGPLMRRWPRGRA
jgi:O-antigen/teichoic acid export membrane protein